MTDYGRTRTKTTQIGSEEYYPLVAKWGTLEHGFNFPPQALSSASMGETVQVTSDWETANYKSRLANGEIINNPFKMSKVTVTNPRPKAYELTYYVPNGYACGLHGAVQYHHHYCKTIGDFRPVDQGYLTWSEVERDVMRNRVISAASTQALASIDPSEMLAGASLAESGKTIDSMRAILYRVFKLFIAAKKLNIRAIRNEFTPTELADRYMELRYAIRPLVYDVKQLAAAVQTKRGLCRKTFRGSSSESAVKSYTMPEKEIRYLHAGVFQQTAEYNVSAKAGILCDVDITEASNFGFTQPIETMWELLPFSFIVDWFCNAGEIIAAHTPDAGVRQLTSWVTIRESVSSSTKLLTHRSLASNPPWSYTTVCQISGDLEWKREELLLERRVGITAASFPRIDLNLDCFKLTDLVIILRKLVFS